MRFYSLSLNILCHLIITILFAKSTISVRLNRSRARQSWNFICEKGHSISGLSSRRIIGDVIVSFDCHPLAGAFSSLLEETDCRLSDEFQLYKKGKWAFSGTNSGCIKGEYLAGVFSSVTGTGRDFERKVSLKCCQTTNANDTDCNFLGPIDPFGNKDTFELFSVSRSNLLCPQIAVRDFAANEDCISLTYCIWNVRNVRYSRACSFKSNEKVSISNEAITNDTDINANNSTVDTNKNAATNIESRVLKCKPDAEGRKKWTCFRETTCIGGNSCEEKCNNWQTGLDFGKVFSWKCISKSSDFGYCCCTYKGNADENCIRSGRQIRRNRKELSKARRIKLENLRKTIFNEQNETISNNAKSKNSQND